MSEKDSIIFKQLFRLNKIIFDEEKTDKIVFLDLISIDNDENEIRVKLDGLIDDNLKFTENQKITLILQNFLYSNDGKEIKIYDRNSKDLLKIMDQYDYILCNGICLNNHVLPKTKNYSMISFGGLHMSIYRSSQINQKLNKESKKLFLFLKIQQ